MTIQSIQSKYFFYNYPCQKNHNLKMPSFLPNLSKIRLMGSVHGTLKKTNYSFVNMNSPQAQMVNDTIQANKVVIFSKSYCPFSSMAKEQFRKLCVPVYVVELDSRHDGEEIQNVLGAMTGSKTVPRCFVDGKFVGGGTDIKRMFELGELKKLVF